MRTFLLLLLVSCGGEVLSLTKDAAEPAEETDAEVVTEGGSVDASAEDVVEDASLCRAYVGTQVLCYGNVDGGPGRTSMLGPPTCDGGPGCTLKVDPAGANPPVWCCQQ